MDHRVTSAPHGGVAGVPGMLPPVQKLEALGRNDLAGQVDRLRQMDRGDNARPLYELGRLAAQRDLLDAHLPSGFDLTAG